MKRFKKIIAGITAAAMIAGLPGLGAAPAVQAAEPEDSLILDFDFDDASTGFTGGNATATGSYTLESSYDGAGQALYLNSASSQYLSVTDVNGGNLLEGLNEITISFDYKSNNSGTNWMFFAAPNANTQNYVQEQYLGIPDIGKTVSVERYYNSGARPSSPSGAVGSDWVHIDAVLTESDTTLYLDGEEVSSVSSTYALSDIFGTTSGVLYIGRANWGAGEYSSFWCDNYKIYDRALSEAEIYALYNVDMTAEAQLEQEGFTVPTSVDVISGTSTVIVPELPVLVEVADNLNITYSSSNTSVATVSANGTVTGKAVGNAVVTTTVNVGSVTKTATTTVNVVSGVDSYLVASYPFDDQSLNNTTGGNDATAIVTGLGSYAGTVAYEEGMAGTSAVRIGDYGLKLNQQNIGTNYTVSFWIKPDAVFGENQVAAFMGYHSPENWMAVSGDTSGYKFWGNGGAFSTWTTVASPAIATGEWQNLVFAGTSGQVTAYLNGVNLGTFTSNDPLSGTNADVYLGVNNWDAEGVGLIDNVNVYNTALSESIVTYYYNQEVLKMAAYEIEKSLGDTSSVKEDLDLSGNVDDVTVTWMSSNPSVISADGIVTRPAEGSADVKVTLTATLSVNGAILAQDYEVTVLAEDAEGDLADAAAALVLPEVIAEDMTLPAEGKFDTSITWATSNANVLAADGSIVSRPGVGEGNEAVTMTATLSLNGKTVTRTFKVEVMEEFYGYILAYTTGTNDLTGSLHLAYSTDGKNFTALNSNTGILFVAVDTNNTNAALSTGYRYTNPHLFRKADGTFGFTATQSVNPGSVYMYDSEDLITYTGERLVATNSTVGTPASAEVEFDASIGAYRVNWATSAGTEYSSVTTDLVTLEKAVAYDYAADTSGDNLTTVPANAITGNVIGVTKAEYDKVVNKLGVVTNTGVEELEDITVKPGESVELPGTITAYYSDNSTTEMNVTWDTDGIDFSKEGTYTVNGTIEQEIYANPLIEQRADPHIEYDPDEDCYYFTASYPAYYNADGGYDRIALRKADTISGLSTAEEIAIWTAPSSGTMAKHVWAPEIHQIEDKWYVFFAAGNSDNYWAIRPYVLVCQNNDDPYNADSWVQADGTAEVYAADSISSESQYFNQMSLDMTYFEHNGRHYVIWADIIGQSALYMQEVNPDSPWQGISKVICLTTPEFAWERDVQRVNEGASVVKNAGKIFVTFSASGTGPEYCIGLLSIDEDADLLDVNAWTKVTYPVLTSSDVPGEYGPGHNSFTVDENGNVIFVYHARSEECYNNQCTWASSDSLYDPCRHARVKRVHWAADGTPILNMSYEEELAPEYANISITVTVTSEEVKVTLPYEDVSEDDWFYEAVYNSYFNGLMTGKGETTFCPLETLSRAQLALILYRMEGSPEVTYNAVFSDVPDGQWFTNAVLWAQENGIVTGYGTTGTFGPHDDIMREQMAVMMYRYANYKQYDTSASADLSAFTDASNVSAYAETAVKWAVGDGIITGKSGGTQIAPLGSTLRAECAVIIDRFVTTY